MPNAPFPIDPVATAVAIAYKNQRHIADQVLPRLTVSKQEFTYLKHNLGESYRMVETEVGRVSQPNRVEFSATKETDSTIDQGLDDPIPLSDIENASPGHNPVLRAVEGVTELISIRREKRVADLVHNPAIYPAANKETLSGANQWSDATSDPVGKIQSSLDACIIRPNVMVIGRQAFSVLTRHPKIVKAMHGNDGDSGIATRKFLADLFELEEVLVGEAFGNTAKKGQAVSMARLWGKHAALIHRNLLGGGMSSITTFGFTAQWGGKISNTFFDKNIGVRGGQVVRVGESVKELVCAADLGFLLSNVVA